MPTLPLFRFLPAIIAAVTDLFACVIVIKIQPVYPIQVIAFQLIMFGLALSLALPYRWLWVFAFVLLTVGAWVTSFSLLYVPTVIAAGWVMARRLDSVGSPDA